MSSSGNLLKLNYNYTYTQDSEKRVIDVNALIAKRMEELAQKAETPVYMDFPEEEPDMMGGGDGFTAGLTAKQVEGLLGDMDFDGETSGNVIKGGFGETGEDEAAPLEESPDMAAYLEEARQQAQEEAEKLLASAREQIAAERAEALEHARQQGYQEGEQRAKKELEAEQRKLEERGKALEAEYENILKELEPKLVDVISDAYEYLIGEELSGYRDILMYMISSAIRKIEGGKSFLVHISSLDYPYVSMEKKLLEGALPSPSATLELVEDTTLSHNECMIETEGGIFDCSLGTQMSELKKRLKLLAYEKK